MKQAIITHRVKYVSKDTFSNENLDWLHPIAIMLKCPICNLTVLGRKVTNRLGNIWNVPKHCPECKKDNQDNVLIKNH